VTTKADLGLHYRQATGRTIAACRAERGLSLRGLADSSELSLAYLSELERGQKEPSGSTLEQLAHAFELPLADLLRLIADRIEEQSAPPEISIEGLGRDEIGELSRFAQWLRWKKEQPG